MYDSRIGWLGTLDVMKPGEGYMLKVNGTGPQPLTYPNTTTLKSSPLEVTLTPPLSWAGDYSQYEGNLSIVARLDLKNVPDLILNNQMALGAFIDDQCHGFISPVGGAEIGYVPFFLNVSNTGLGHIIQFRLFDGSTGKTYTIQEIKPFEYNAVYGTLNEPLVLTLKGLMTGTGEIGNNGFFRCYPNPFSSEVDIEFIGTGNETTIDLINMTGSRISLIYKGISVTGKNLVHWNGTNESGNEVAPGIYFIRMISGNSTETAKISKID
jgi:hypothetical protein